MSITRLHRKSVFISYSREDIAYARKLYSQLIEFRSLDDQHKVFFDESRLKPGDEWQERIEQALNEADVFVLLISDHFLNSGYCMRIEADHALRRKLDRDAEVFLVLLSDCKWELSSPPSTKGKLPFGKLQLAGPIAKNGRRLPVEEWDHPNAAWTQIVDKLYEYFGIGNGRDPDDLHETCFAAVCNCDREIQHSVFEEQLKSRSLLNRPFFAWACGSEHETPKQLIHRFATLNIPAYLERRSGSVKPLLQCAKLPELSGNRLLRAFSGAFGPVKENDKLLAAYSQVFFRDAVDKWTGNSPAEVGEKLVEDKRPKIFWSIVRTDDVREADTYRRQIGTFLNELPDMPEDRPLFVLLFIEHPSAASDAFKKTRVTPHRDLRCCPLPPLAPVGETEIKNWFKNSGDSIAQLVGDPAAFQTELGNMRAANGGLSMSKVIEAISKASGIPINSIF